MLSVLRMSVQGPLCVYQDNSNNPWQLQETVILETSFIHIYVLNHIFLSPNTLFISLYITAQKKLKIWIKTTLWLQLSLLIENWKKNLEDNLNNTGTKCTQFRKMSTEHWWNDADRGNKSTGIETCHNVTLSTTDLTWTDLGSKPGYHGAIPATNGLF
jgi:hypothetical protein